MIKKISVLSFLFLSTGLAAPSPSPTPCPTCPKGFVHSSLEEVLLAKKSMKDLAPKKTGLNAVTSKNMTSAPLTKTPVQIVASRTEQLKQESRPTQKADMFGSLTPSKISNSERVVEENRKRMEAYARQEFLRRHVQKQGK